MNLCILFMCCILYVTCHLLIYACAHIYRKKMDLKRVIWLWNAFRWYFHFHILTLWLRFHPLKSPYFPLPPSVPFSPPPTLSYLWIWTQNTFDCKMFWCNWLMLQHFCMHFPHFSSLFLVETTHTHTKSYIQTLQCEYFFSKLFFCSVHSKAMGFISSPFMRSFFKSCIQIIITKKPSSGNQ